MKKWLPLAGVALLGGAGFAAWGGGPGGEQGRSGEEVSIEFDDFESSEDVETGSRKSGAEASEEPTSTEETASADDEQREGETRNDSASGAPEQTETDVVVLGVEQGNRTPKSAPEREADRASEKSGPQRSPEVSRKEKVDSRANMARLNDQIRTIEDDKIQRIDPQGLNLEKLPGSSEND